MRRSHGRKVAHWSGSVSIARAAKSRRVSARWDKGARKTLNAMYLFSKLNYPSQVKGTMITLPLETEYMPPAGQVLVDLAAEYATAMGKASKQAYGHVLGDLYFEELTIFEDGYVDVGVGS